MPLIGNSAKPLMTSSYSKTFFVVGAFLSLFYIFLFSLPVASALTWNVDLTTVNGNSSNYWNTADHGSLGNVSEILHNWLGNLEWSVAGHTMDTNLDMNSHNIQEIDKAYFSSYDFISSDDTRHLDLHADYIDLHGNLSTIWNVRLNTDGNGSVGPSHGNLVFGSGGDTYLFYNGSDFIIDPDAVGSGDVVVLGDIRADNFNGINISDLPNTYVPYTGATSNLDLGANNFSVNTDSLFVNKENGNVGIGTTAPGAKLEINQSTDENALQINGYDDVSSEWVKLNVDSGGYGGLYTSSKTIIAGRDADGTERGFAFDWYPGWVNVAAEGISIMTWDINFKINDNKNIIFGGSNDFYLGYDETTDDRLELKDNNNNLFLTVKDQGTTADFDFNAGDVFIKNDGNVGIGTTGPDSKLQVAGDIHLQNDSDKLFFGQAKDISVEMNGTSFNILNEISSIPFYLTGFLGYFFDGDVTIDGDLNVTGSIHNSLSHMIGYVTEQHNVTDINTWYNLTFNDTLGDITGLTLEDNRTVIIPHDGHYTITLGAGIQDTAAFPDSKTALRITLNGEELTGSIFYKDLDKKDADTWGEHTTHASLNAGDELNMQYISDVTTVSIYRSNEWAVTSFNAYGYIQEVII